MPGVLNRPMEQMSLGSVLQTLLQFCFNLFFFFFIFIVYISDAWCAYAVKVNEQCFLEVEVEVRGWMDG